MNTPNDRQSKLCYELTTEELIAELQARYPAVIVGILRPTAAYTFWAKGPESILSSLSTRMGIFIDKLVNQHGDN